MAEFTVKKLEDCLDGSVRFEYAFHYPIDVAAMNRLAARGDLEYHPDFARPFYKVICESGEEIKGIIGDGCFEVLFPQEGKELKKRRFEDWLQTSMPGKGGE